MNITRRKNWDELKAKLDEQGITSLYHFTDRRNLASIIENGGLYSWQDCLKYGIAVERPGGNEVSHSLDVHKHLENYVRLSFVKNHPMMYIAQDDDRELQPVVLEISTHVLSWIGTKFSDRNATKNDVQVRSDLNHIHFDVLKHKAVFDIEDEDLQQFYQAEVLVENCVPVQFIKNLKDVAPDLIAKRKELSPEEKFASYKKNADYGNTYYMLLLANLYHKGFGTEVDLSKSEEYFLKYAYCGSPAGYRLLSDIYLEKDDDASFSKALSLLELGSKMPGGMRCTFKIARLKLVTENDVHNVPSLLETLKENATYHKDDLFYMYRLFNGGCKSEEGLTLVEKDRELALYYLQLAAEEEHSKAISLLAKSFRTNKDHKNAYKWYLKAAELGDEDAFFYAAYYSKDIDRNYKQAIYWYQMSVDAGSSSAMNNLAIMYERGEGVEADENKAFELYKMAVDNGNTATGCNNLAVCYEHGTGTEINLLKAFQCRLKAAKSGSADAIRWLIEAYKTGEIIEADEDESIYWMMELSKHNTVKPDEVYGLAQHFRGKDDSKFQHYIEQAAELGHRGALIELGRYNELALFPPNVYCSYYDIPEQDVMYSDDGVYAYACGYKLKNAVVKKGTLVIASECFSGRENLKEIILPDSIRLIGKRSFAKCKHLFSIRNQSPFFTTMNGFLLSQDLKRLITYFGSDENISIPQGVELIDEAAFAGKPIRKVILPDTIKKIESAAFYECDKLVEINLPKGILEIGEYAFEGCKKLSTIDYPCLDVIPRGCFLGSGLVSIRIPDTIQTIGKYAFCGCNQLKDVVLNEGLLKIEELAFKNCNKLKSVNIPSTLSEIGQLAFTRVKNMSANNNKYFVADNGLYEKNANRIILLRYLLDEDSANIVRGTTDIADYALADLPLQHVTIPDTVERIGIGAFESCTNLEDFICPPNLCELGNDAIYKCTSLKEVVFSSNIANIGKSGIGSCARHLRECTILNDTVKLGFFDFDNDRGGGIPSEQGWCMRQIDWDYGLPGSCCSDIGNFEYYNYHFVLYIHKGTIDRVQQALQEHCHIVEID